MSALRTSTDRLATEAVIAAYLRDIRPRRGSTRAAPAPMISAWTPAHRMSFRGGRKRALALSGSC